MVDLFRCKVDTLRHLASIHIYFGGIVKWQLFINKHVLYIVVIILKWQMVIMLIMQRRLIMVFNDEGFYLMGLGG